MEEIDPHKLKQWLGLQKKIRIMELTPTCYLRTLILENKSMLMQTPRELPAHLDSRGPFNIDRIAAVLDRKKEQYLHLAMPGGEYMETIAYEDSARRARRHTPGYSRFMSQRTVSASPSPMLPMCCCP